MDWTLEVVILPISDIDRSVAALRAIEAGGVIAMARKAEEDRDRN